MEQWIKTFFDNYVSDMYFPNVHLTDIIEIIIVSIIVYEIMLWIKNTKAWMLLKGMIVLGLFILLYFECIRYCSLPESRSTFWQ